MTADRPPKPSKRAHRRDQIFSAAAKLIAEHGFVSMTMRDLADEAGVSTGMVNHYFANKAQVLLGTLQYVSERMQTRIQGAIRGVEPGQERLRILIESALPTDDFTRMNWKIWIHAFAEAGRSDEMRELIRERYVSWHKILEDALIEVRATPDLAVPAVLQLDAMINGLVIHHIITGPSFSTDDIRDALLELVDSWHNRS
jgi:TetR/AcrR family transcriptional repressor of bet genes